MKNICSVVKKDKACTMHGKNVSLFAHNMYNPRPHKYNELPVNDLSTKKGTDIKPLRFPLSSSCFCAPTSNFFFAFQAIFCYYQFEDFNRFYF
jgi:hypothetical protein